MGDGTALARASERRHVERVEEGAPALRAQGRHTHTSEEEAFAAGGSNKCAEQHIPSPRK